jgi:cytochrome P450
VRPDLDLKALDNARDPFPVLRWLRDHEPVHWSESLSAWVVTRYDDVLEIFDRPAEFSSDRFRKVDARFTSRREEVRAVAAVLSEWMVFRDPPDHTRLRARSAARWSSSATSRSRCRPR